jgi:hypothetical protein
VGQKWYQSLALYCLADDTSYFHLKGHCSVSCQPCSHWPTARVGHSRVSFPTLTSWRWTRLRQEGWVPSNKMRRVLGYQYYTMNEEIQHDRWASYTSGTSFNSRDEYCNDLDLHKRSLWEEDGNEDNVAAPDVHQRGGDVNQLAAVMY